MKKTHDYVHYYRGYWSDGGKCRISIYQEKGRDPVVICSQLPDNGNTSVTNMAEYLTAEVIEKHGLATPLTWIEHYPEHRGKPGEYSLVTFTSWERREVCLGGVVSSGFGRQFRVGLRRPGTNFRVALVSCESNDFDGLIYHMGGDYSSTQGYTGN